MYTVGFALETSLNTTHAIMPTSLVRALVWSHDLMEYSRESAESLLGLSQNGETTTELSLDSDPQELNVDPSNTMLKL